MRSVWIFCCGFLAVTGCNSQNTSQSKSSAAPKESGIVSALKSPFRWAQSKKSTPPTQPSTTKVAKPRRANIAKDTQKDSLAKARNLLQRRKFKESLKTCERLLEFDQRNAETHTLRGDCLHQLSRFEEAAVSYKVALSIDPKSYMARRGLAFSQLNQAKKWLKEEQVQKSFELHRLSLENLRTCAKILPKDAEVAFARAINCDALTDFFSARALRLRDQNNDLQGAETMFNLAFQISQEGIQSAKAYMHFQNSLVMPRVMLGRLHLRRATLAHAFGRVQQADKELTNSAATWQSILRDVDRNHKRSREQLQYCHQLHKKWQAMQRPVPGAVGLQPES